MGKRPLRKPDQPDRAWWRRLLVRTAAATVLAVFQMNLNLIVWLPDLGIWLHLGR